MKRWIGLIMVLAALMFAGSAIAGSCTLTATEKVTIDQRSQRVYLTLTCTGDGSIDAYSLNPVTHNVKGWYLYNVTTNPGTSAPTADYDITLVVDGEDVAGGLLANRSATATETVTISPSTKGYHMTDQTMAITFANETANPSTIVMKLRFTSN